MNPFTLNETFKIIKLFLYSFQGWKLLYIIGLVEALVFCGLGWLLSGFTVNKNSLAAVLSQLAFRDRPM
jgi:hypothetical protein